MHKKVKNPKTKTNKTKDQQNEELTHVKFNRKQALKALANQKPIEDNKIALGYKWLTNGKICKLVHPKNIEKNLYKGFRIISKT